MLDWGGPGHPLNPLPLPLPGPDTGPTIGPAPASPGQTVAPAPAETGQSPAAMWTDGMSTATVPIPEDLASCIDLVDMSPGELQVRAARIRAVLPTVDKTDRGFLLDDLRDVEGEIEGRKHTDDVDKEVTETISDASAGNEAWNGTYSWQSKFHSYANRGNHTVVATINLSSDGTEGEKATWRQAVEAKWSNKVRMEVTPPGGQQGPPESYDVRVVCRFVDDAKKADYNVKAQRPGATEEGRAGKGGTTSMTGWGVEDKVDITHEFGHMLGNPEEYFTTNGHDYTDGGKQAGFRDPKGGVMNNPDGPALASNFEQIRQSAARALGVDESRCSVHQ
jgi:hypothetical protein